MNEDEKSIASILLAKISEASDKGSSETTAAIARYKEFVEACNFRIRKLVVGWAELESLADIPEEENTEAPQENSVISDLKENHGRKDKTEDPELARTEWWVLDVDYRGNFTNFDGPHRSRVSAIQVINSIDGQRKLVTAEVYI